MVASVMTNEDDERAAKTMKRLATAVRILVAVATVLTVVLTAWFLVKK